MDKLLKAIQTLQAMAKYEKYRETMSCRTCPYVEPEKALAEAQEALTCLHEMNESLRRLEEMTKSLKGIELT